MKMEDHFKESLNRAVANEPPVLDAWDRFEQRAHRGRNVRLFASIFAAAAVVVAAVIIVPQLGTGDGLGLSTEPTSQSPSPTVTSTTDPYEGWATFGPMGGAPYGLRYPNDWRATSFHGVSELLAPGQPPTSKGDPTMAVTLTLDDQEFDDPDKFRRAGFDRSTRSDGRPFVWREEELPDGGRRVDYRIEWSFCVRADSTPGCVRSPRTLVVTIYAGTRQLWDTYGETAERIVTSIEYTQDAPNVETG